MRGAAVATSSMFYGIVILVYNEKDGKHHAPRIHARFAEYECSIDEGLCRVQDRSVAIGGGAHVACGG